MPATVLRHNRGRIALSSLLGLDAKRPNASIERVIHSAQMPFGSTQPLGHP